jgi:hypothetical protein
VNATKSPLEKMSLSFSAKRETLSGKSEKLKEVVNLQLHLHRNRHERQAGRSQEKRGRNINNRCLD